MTRARRAEQAGEMDIDKLLKVLEAQIGNLVVQLAAANVRIDELTAENAALKDGKGKPD